MIYDLPSMDLCYWLRQWLKLHWQHGGLQMVVVCAVRHGSSSMCATTIVCMCVQYYCEKLLFSLYYVTDYCGQYGDDESVHMIVMYIWCLWCGMVIVLKMVDNVVALDWDKRIHNNMASKPLAWIYKIFFILVVFKAIFCCLFFNKKKKFK